MLSPVGSGSVVQKGQGNSDVSREARETTPEGGRAPQTRAGEQPRRCFRVEEAGGELYCAAVIILYVVDGQK